MSLTLTGLLGGIALGFAAAFGGLSAFVIVLVFAAVGLLVGRYLDGQLDLSRIDLSRFVPPRERAERDPFERFDR